MEHPCVGPGGTSLVPWPPPSAQVIPSGGVRSLGRRETEGPVAGAVSATCSAQIKVTWTAAISAGTKWAWSSAAGTH
jgi:hypothetical protein